MISHRLVATVLLAMAMAFIVHPLPSPPHSAEALEEKGANCKKDPNLCDLHFISITPKAGKKASVGQHEFNQFLHFGTPSGPRMVRTKRTRFLNDDDFKESFEEVDYDIDYDEYMY